MQKIKAKCIVCKQQCMLLDETVYYLMKHLTQVLKLLEISDKTNKSITACYQQKPLYTQTFKILWGVNTANIYLVLDIQ